MSAKRIVTAALLWLCLAWAFSPAAVHGEVAKVGASRLAEAAEAWRFGHVGRAATLWDALAADADLPADVRCDALVNLG